MGFDSILAGAAAAAGTAPTDPAEYQRWLGRVSVIAADLSKLAHDVGEHEKRKADCLAAAEVEGTKKHFYGLLVNAKVITKGSGDKQVQKGYLQFAANSDSQSVDEEGFEHIETAPINTPAGAFEFGRAQNLIGQYVVAYKKIIPLPSGRKARECAAIDPAEGPRQSGPASRPTQAPAAPSPAPAPQSTQAPASPPEPDVPLAGGDLDELVEQATAMFEGAEVVEDYPPAQVAAAPAAPAGDLGEMTPKSEQELATLAEKYLGKSAGEIHEILVEKYNVPPGKSLPSRQYTVVWKELVGAS